MKHLMPVSKLNWKGPVIIIGFGSIGTATLPLLYKHFSLKRDQVVVIDPCDTHASIARTYGARFLRLSLTPNNYSDVLKELTNSTEQSLIINVSVNVSSRDIIQFANKSNALYIDTTIDPWPGIYFNDNISNVKKSNYAFRESLRELRNKCAGGPTAVSCCGANPGMVSWFVKRALLNIASDVGHVFETPRTRGGWARLMMDLGIKGIHIAERDSQKTNITRPRGTFINTWSVEGFLAEAFQPAELGWGTHEKTLPCKGNEHSFGCGSAIYIDKPGATIRVKTWTPTEGPHFGFLITHNESISISDYFTVQEGGEVIYRPTCHYAYRPSDFAVDSLLEVLENNGKLPKKMHVLTENEITEGVDELGVLLFGHKKNAYWYGSQLSIDETRRLVPYQNATGLQVSSALIAGIFWAIKHPHEGLVETEEMDHEECLAWQKSYLGNVEGYYTDWTPSHHNDDGKWQFSNIVIEEPMLTTPALQVMK